MSDDLTMYRWEIVNFHHPGTPDTVDAAYYAIDDNNQLIQFKDDEHKPVFAVNISSVRTIRRGAPTESAPAQAGTS